MVVLGAINWDTTVFERRFARPGEEVPVARVEECPGGKGANTAVAAARILGKGGVAFLGALGRDRARGPLMASLEEAGVRTDGVVTVEGGATGRAFIVVDGSGQKTIHTRFGANESLEPKHLRSAPARSIIASSRAVIIMDVPLAAALAAARDSPGGSRVVFSPGVRGSGPKGQLSEVISEADELVLDRSELLKLSGRSGPREGVQALVSRYHGLNVVATLGPDGCLVAGEKGTTRVPPVDLRDLGMNAVNSAGSGDAFLASYACYSMFGLAPAEAARWGNLAGALKAARAETRGSPTRETLEKKMRVLDGVIPRPRGSP